TRNEKKATDAGSAPADKTSPRPAATADARPGHQQRPGPGAGEHDTAAAPGPRPHGGPQPSGVALTPANVAGAQPAGGEPDADSRPGAGDHANDDIDIDTEDGAGEGGQDTAGESADDPPGPAGPGRARACVLGPPRIVDLSPPRQPREQGLRSKALEVLV